MVKYRRRSPDERPKAIETSTALEVIWTVIPAMLCAFAFIWASSLYFRNSRPPNASMEVFVVGKQWMWHLQHPEGAREINELHVPGGRAGEVDHDFRGCDSRFFDSGVSD